MKKSCTQEIIGFREKCPRKISFLGNFIPQKRQDWHFRTFLKSVILMKKFVEKKTIFGTIFFEKIQILDEFSHDAAVFKTRCLNVSDFELTFHISSNFETKFQERVRLWIRLFSKLQFRWKLCFWESTLWDFFEPYKCHFLQYFVFAKSTNLGKMEKKCFWYTISNAGQILNQLFHIASDFESRTLKVVRFTANFLQFVSFSIELLTGCQI